MKRIMDDRESVLANAGSNFKARKMPDFGKIASFVPMLNEQPLTMSIPFKLRLDERAERRRRDEFHNEDKENNGGYCGNVQKSSLKLARGNNCQ